MPPSGPLYAGAISGGVDWTTQSNAIGVENGTTADNGNEGPGGGGHTPTQLVSSSHGFALPATAVIDGIKLEAKVFGNTNSTDLGIYVGTPTKLSPNKVSWPTGQLWPNPAAFLTYGGAADLWGRTDWTVADINSSTFGASISAFAQSGTGTISVDAIRITVYWHVANQIVPKRYLYRVLNSAGQYLGLLPDVKSEFGFAQDINTAGSQITIECATSPDTSRQSTGVLTDEAGNPLLDESSVNLTDEGAVPAVAPGAASNSALIKNGNQVQVWEVSYYYPNGKCLFLGVMERWEASFGGSGQSETVRILCYSDGQDLDNFLVRGNPYTYTTDVSQATQNASVLVSTAGMGGGHDWFGQTWVVGGGVTNLGAISLYLYGTAHVSVDVFATPNNTGVALATTSQFVSVGGPTEIQFGLPTSIVTTPGGSLFFQVRVDAGESINLYYQNTNPYANGQMHESIYGGAGGGGYNPIAGSDLYFKTASGTGSTIGTFTSLDPTTGMLETFMNDYIARGGLITYNSATIDATGLSLTYTFNTNTIYEGVKAALSLAPSGFYYYVDLGTDTLYMKRASTTADIVLIKGRHIDRLVLTATIENVKNQVYFTGGATSGVNLYKTYSDAASIALYGPRLDRKTDNRVTVAGTADAIGQSEIAEMKDENYSTSVTVQYRTMDTTLLKPGLIIGFSGFGTFVDGLLAQIVRVDYTPEEVSLTLGILPKRLHPEFDRVTRGLIAQQTIANPSAPS